MPETKVGPVGLLLSDESKWWNGSDGRPRDAICLGVAIKRSYSEAAVRVIYRQIAARLGYSGPVNWEDAFNILVAWNDAPERTFPEVRALIEELEI